MTEQGNIHRIDSGLYVQVEADGYTVHDEHGFVRFYPGELPYLIETLAALMAEQESR